MHCMFLCPTSRQVWFTSPSAIRVHALPMDIVATVQQLMGVLEEEGLIIFANTLWKIWKERNKDVIEHSAFKPQAVLQRVKIAAEVNRERGQVVQRNSQRIVHEKYCYDGHAWQVLVDASWATPTKGGGTYVTYERGMVHSIGLHHFEAFDLFHAEAMTVREAMRYMFDQLSLPFGTKVELFSDCMNLVTAVNQEKTIDLPSWRASSVVGDIITRLQSREGEVTLSFVSREAVKQPHKLANIARRTGIEYQGQPQVEWYPQARLNEPLDDVFFQQVQEEPP